MYHGIKVYLIGAFERARARDKMTIEQKIFGQSDELARQKEIKAQIVKLQAQLNEH